LFQTGTRGWKYKGDFFEGKMHGRGKLTLMSGAYFEGKFINNISQKEERVFTY